MEVVDDCGASFTGFKDASNAFIGSMILLFGSTFAVFTSAFWGGWVILVAGVSINSPDDLLLMEGIWTDVREGEIICALTIT